MGISRLLSGALALAVLGVPVAALADDPRDPAMRSPEARERDRAMIRELNLRQLEYVRKRDAEYAHGWQAYRDYPRAQREYQRRMAEWRCAVRLCEDGHYEYCQQ